MKISDTTTGARWTEENIIDLVRKLRNDLIKDFLDERFLKQYVASNFGVKELSAVKIEFIKTALKEKLISPVNKQHYAVIIDQIRDTDTASLTDGNERLFYFEIESELKKFIF